MEHPNSRPADLGRWKGRPTQGDSEDWGLLLTSSRSKSEISEASRMCLRVTAKLPRVLTPVSSSASGCLKVKSVNVVDGPPGTTKPVSVSREPTAFSGYVWLLLLPGPEGSPQTAFVCHHHCRSTRCEGTCVQVPVRCNLAGGSHSPTNKSLRKTLCDC